MAVSQQDRLIRIATPLEEDTFVVLSFAGCEAVSQLFSFELTLASTRNDITFEQLAGKNITVAIRSFDGSERFFNGLIVALTPDQVSDQEGYCTYHARMVPSAWTLEHCRDCRIFQNKPVGEIIKAVLDQTALEAKKVGGVIDYDLRLGENHMPRPYCVQYNETDFDFISRLCEDEGIFFYFEHEKGRHTLVFSDDSPGQKPFAQGEKATVGFQQSQGSVNDRETITRLLAGNQMTTAAYTSRDYNFTIPDNDMTVRKSSCNRQCKGRGEIYEYPGGYEKANEGGEHLARVRMQAMDARYSVLTGASDCRGLAPGFKFTLKNHGRKPLNGRSYLLLKVIHQADQPFTSGGGESAGYQNYFACMPAETPFRPERKTPAPVIAGSQTAIVTGPPDEEIHTDAHGRVKVRFHWDRNPAKKSDEQLTCWIRVSQLWAGSGYGALHTPRIGQEVIVNFLDGDPDRPVITGRLYHGKNLPPFDLPVEKTKSTIMSESTKNGKGQSNFIIFEDQKGAEDFSTHAAKDRNEVVENDKSTKVKNNQNIHVKQNRSAIVAQGKDSLEVQKGGRDVMVAADEKHTNAADFKHKVSGSYTLRVNGNITIDATGIVKIMGAKVIINP